MVLALNPNEPWRYVLEDDRKAPEDEQTGWLLRVLTPLEQRQMQSRMARNNASQIADLMLDLLRWGLEGVEGFTADDGEPVEMDVESFVPAKLFGKSAKAVTAPTVEWLERVAPHYREELSVAIAGGPRLTEDDRKN